MKKSKEILQKILANATLAVGAVVHCINAVYNPLENGFQTEANAFANCGKFEAMKVGMAAFLEGKGHEL